MIISAHRFRLSFFGAAGLPRAFPERAARSGDGDRQVSYVTAIHFSATCSTTQFASRIERLNGSIVMKIEPVFRECLKVCELEKTSSA